MMAAQLTELVVSKTYHVVVSVANDSKALSATHFFNWCIAEEHLNWGHGFGNFWSQAQLAFFVATGSVDLVDLASISGHYFDTQANYLAFFRHSLTLQALKYKYRSDS